MMALSLLGGQDKEDFDSKLNPRNSSYSISLCGQQKKQSCLFRNENKHALFD